jgi:SAM-dependent methyltransferase
MMDVIRQLTGRASICFDLLLSLKQKLRGAKRKNDGYDKTGLVQGSRPLALEYFPGNVCLVRYESLAHTFWRAQELTLLNRHRAYLERPLADFGCGDGSFGASLFSKIDFGIDNDPEALAACQRQKAYGQGVLVSGLSIPLPSSSLGSVFANSVLEHTLEPETWFSEIGRLLRPGGVFMMTVPVLNFARHLTRYFGLSQSQKINRDYHHNNLVEPEKWLQSLERNQMDPFLVKLYQGPLFTYYYRMLRLVGPQGTGMIPFFQDWVWKKFNPKMVKMVEESVAGAEGGANLFVVARRR